MHINAHIAAAPDAEIAEALACLPLPRLENIARLLVHRLDATARARLAGALGALPAVVGSSVERMVQGALASAFLPRSGRS